MSIKQIGKMGLADYNNRYEFLAEKYEKNNFCDYVFLGDFGVACENDFFDFFNDAKTVSKADAKRILLALQDDCAGYIVEKCSYFDLAINHFFALSGCKKNHLKAHMQTIIN